MENKTVPSFGGAIPKNYEQHLYSLFFENYAVDIIDRIKHLKPATILELAAGTGIVTKHLAETFPSSKIYVTDLNPDMLDVAKKKLSRDSIEWKITDMQEIPFEDNYFDMIVCQFGIMFVPEKQKAIKEMYRVLKPGGFLILNSWDKLENNTVAFTAHETINRFFKDDPIPFYNVPFSYNDEKEIKSNIEEAGFKNVKITLAKYHGYNESVDDSIIGLVEGVPVINSINERDPSLVPEIKSALRKELAKKFSEKNPKFPLQAWVTTATKE